MSNFAKNVTLVQAELALPYACRMHVRTVKPKSIPELVTEVEDFFTTRRTTWDEAGESGQGAAMASGDRPEASVGLQQ